jgi:hypothetical protein
MGKYRHFRTMAMPIDCGSGPVLRPGPLKIVKITMRENQFEGGLGCDPCQIDKIYQESGNLW